MKKWYAISGVVIILLLFCALIPESADLSDVQGSEPTIIMPQKIPTATYRLVQKNLPYATILRSERSAYGSPLGHLKEERITAVWTDSIQAEKMCAQDPDLHWYPYTEIALVLLVDPAELPTGAWIQSFDDILDHPVSFGINKQHGIDELLVGADCILSDGKMDLDTLISYLRVLHRERRLHIMTEEDRPQRSISPSVLLMFSDMAEEDLRQDPHLQIVIPREGTFVYTYGLLSKRPLPKPYLQTIDTGETQVYGTQLDPEAIRAYSEAFDTSTARIRREVLRQRLYGSADGTEHLMFYLGMGLIILFWAGTLYIRTVDPKTQKDLLIITALMIGWFFVRLIAFFSDKGSIIYRLASYNYYLPILFIPHGLLRIALMQRPSSKLRILKRPLLILGALLYLLVLTQDIHHLLYRNAGYGPLYPIIVIYIAAQILLTLYLMDGASREIPGNKRRIALLIPFALYAIHTWGFVYRIDFFYYSEVTFTTCIVYLLFLESCYYAGILSGTMNYEHLFCVSDLNMVVLDRAYTIRYRSSREIPAELLDNGIRQLKEKEDFSAEEVGGYLLFGKKIRGGHTLWWSDIRPIRELQRKLHDLLRQLEKDNDLLAEREEIESRLAAAKWKNAIYQDIEQQFSRQLAQVKQGLTDPGNTTEQQGQRFLYRISFSFRYLKWKTRLLIAAKSDEPIRIEELIHGIQECAKVLQMRVHIINNFGDHLRENDALALFDILCTIIKQADAVLSSSVLIRLSQRKEICRCAVYLERFGEEDWDRESLDIIRRSGFTAQTKYDKEAKETVLTLRIAMLPEEIGSKQRREI
ncbi:MAG: histidine kinase N-terminal 7TM domain-containing protein [Peptostreptococcaceae bacterium]|nr:histidine kinase N-terminal 7TM domain-containing protein [Peptostreptococcaceae bacterium]